MMDDQGRGGRQIERRRSSSTSGVDRLSSTLEDEGLPIGNPGESNIRGEDRTVSDPNLFVSQGSFSDSPWGLDNLTNLLHRNRGTDGVRTQILSDFNALKRETFIWEGRIEENNITNQERNQWYEQLISEITRISAEAICNSVDRSTYSEIRGLKERIERSQRSAERAIKRGQSVTI